MALIKKSIHKRNDGVLSGSGLADVTTISNQVTTIEDEFSALQQSYQQQLSDRVAEIYQSIVQVDNQLSALGTLEQRLNALKTKVSPLTSALIPTIAQSAEEIWQRISSILNDVFNERTRLEEMRTALNTEMQKYQ